MLTPERSNVSPNGLAPEPNDASADHRELVALKAALADLANEAHDDWHNDYAAARIRALIVPSPRQGERR